MLAADGLTIQEAAATTGWSPRMLRYLEQAGLVEPDRTVSGYRLFGPGHLQRLRTLRELLERHSLTLADVGLVRRLRSEPDLASAIDRWLTDEPLRPAGVAASDWLRFEQEKHERLLSGLGGDPERPYRPDSDPTTNTSKESA